MYNINWMRPIPEPEIEDGVSKGSWVGGFMTPMPTIPSLGLNVIIEGEKFEVTKVTMSADAVLNQGYEVIVINADLKRVHD